MWMFIAFKKPVQFQLKLNNNTNSEVLLDANIHRPDATLASQEREESED